MSGACPDEAVLDTMLESVAADLEREGAPRTGDEALVARAIDGALGRVRASEVAATARRRLAVRAFLAAAAIVLVAAVAGAMMWRSRRAPPASASPAATALALESVAGTGEASSDAPPAAPPLDTSRASSAAPSVTASEVANEPPLTAAVLFARANDARRRGDVGVAVRRYGDLERLFPSSQEARMAHVALGRLYLDRLGRPAEALTQFDAYLRGGGGALSEEATVGRALAFERLGRAGEEKAAWQALLAAFPSSLSADRARARLSQLP
jgi:hypothetical protein